ncbi:MobC family plasmid mobilization relaxosome protein [Streptomyces sp. NPDC059568]|uniref:MobC family plasmid mobilization relaxosome protein n=1 Tax=Streptomyces sp. NPDC059568 TaxID=3346868 RepID=UPI0036926CE7
MHDQHHQLTTAPQQMITAPATSGARNGAGPSTGRSSAVSAPGVAEELGHQGAPEEEKPRDTTAPSLPRAADEAALHRVARRRKRDTSQRKERVDVRYSVDEKTEILAKARSLNIAGAHYVGAVVMAHVHGDLALPGQRTPLDDYIDELNALRHQVATIGRNVNQIARVLNSGGHPQPGDTALLAQTERTLTAVGTTIRHIAHAAHQAATKTAGR